MATEKDYIEQLSSLVSEDRLIEIIDQAEASPDAEQYYQQVLRDMQVEPEPADGAAAVSPEDARTIEQCGMEIVPVINTYFDRRERVAKSVTAGYELKKQRADGVFEYCGKTLQFDQRYKSVPFETVQEATLAARIWVDLQNETPGARGEVLTYQELRLPLMLSVSETPTPASVSLKMTQEETSKLYAIRRALRALNVEVKTDEPVDSYADAVRWLLSKVKI